MELIKELLEARSKKRVLDKKSTRTVVLKDFSELEDEGIGEFDILITYTVQDLGSTHHPYGEGDVEQDDGLEIEVEKVETKTAVEQFDKETGYDLVKTWPKGTDVSDLPGYKKAMEKKFEDAASEDAYKDRK